MEKCSAPAQRGDGWQEEAVREGEEARLLSSRSQSKLHLDGQAYLSLTSGPASLQNHNILNPEVLSVFQPPSLPPRVDNHELPSSFC